jgi:hypothetical protein
MALAESVKLFETIDCPILPDDDEDDENNDMP